MLELAEEALDEVALAIDAPVDRAMHQALSGRRNVGRSSAGPDQIEKRICVITAVGDDMTALEALEQVRCGAQIVGLASREHEPQGQPILIDQGIDLGAQSATRTADGVIFAPFLPPAAC